MLAHCDNCVSSKVNSMFLKRNIFKFTPKARKLLVEKYCKYFALGKQKSKLFDVFISHKPKTAVGPFTTSQQTSHPHLRTVNESQIGAERENTARKSDAERAGGWCPGSVQASVEFRYCIHKAAEMNVHFPQNLV